MLRDCTEDKGMKIWENFQWGRVMLGKKLENKVLNENTFLLCSVKIS